MRINSDKVKEIIESSSNVVIVSHNSLDLDALSSCLGMFYVCSNLDKNAYILIDDLEHEHGVNRALNKIKKLNYNVDILNFNGIKEVIDDDTILIILDTNKKERIQNVEVFDIIKNKIIIDHHIKDEKYKLEYEYINSDESSTSEIITDLISDLNIYIPEYIASIMLSGIIIDTNKFYLKTGENTFGVASILKRFGADTTEIQYLLKQDYSEYIDRQKIIINTEFIDNIGIALGSPIKIYENEELAKAADTILMFNDVEASFVIGYISDDEVGISARSLGKIDVQNIMKKLNGGGHKTDAATQLKGVDLDTARTMLIKVIKE